MKNDMVPYISSHTVLNQLGREIYINDEILLNKKGRTFSENFSLSIDGI
jgi:hypothetical protein